MQLLKTKTFLKLVVACCLIVPVVGQTFQSVQKSSIPLHGQAGMPVLLAQPLTKDPGNTWGLPASQSAQIVRYPSADVAFICGPQLKAGSALNPFPWFDTTARAQGRSHGEKAPHIAPIGPMFLAKNLWRNTISGRVSVAARGTVVMGKGTRFTHDLDLAGPPPGYNGHFRVRDASGVERIVKVRSIDSDTRLVLANPWPYTSVSDTVADTFHHEQELGNNTDHYYLANYYDTALVQYINYYRTGDARFLEYARKIADALWHSQWIGDGTVVQGHDNHLPPRSMAFAGLMLRALDGRPEMWDYLEREVRAQFDDWVYRHKRELMLYYDIREDGYAQLYAVMMAKVLPDSYPLYANGTVSARTGTAVNGAAKRATYLAQTEDTALNFFGRLQRADGSWRWNVEESSTNPAQQFRDVEQPFMVGLYLESLVLLHQLSRNPQVKAKLLEQLTRSVRHLYRDTFQRNNRITDLPPHRWRSMFYYWGGGTVANPTQFSPPPANTTANGERENVAAARHFQSTVHHAFGYAYYVTGDKTFKDMGDDVFEASYGDRVDGIHCLAASGKAKDYDMNYRASGRYLVWRLAHLQSNAIASQHSSALAVSPLIPSSRPTTLRNPTVTAQSATGLRSSAPHTTPQQTSSQDTAPELIANALRQAKHLSGDLANKEQIEGLIDEIENALRTFKAFNREQRHSPAPDGIVQELQAALGHARTAMTMLGSDSSGYESARLRLGWAAARLKRADEQPKQKRTTGRAY